MNSEEIRINDAHFLWGMTFDETIALFHAENLKKTASPNYYEILCPKILNLESLVCYFIAPQTDKPVTSFGFDLKVLPFKSEDAVHKPYLERLVEIFGEPDTVSNIGHRTGLKYNEAYESSSVIYSCKWEIRNILVSLSVFGGIRTRKEGTYAAGLYCHYLDEVKITKPYRSDFLKSEAILSDSLDHTSYFQIYEQRPFFRTNHWVQDREAVMENPDLRIAQLILYTKSIYRMPKVFTISMNVDEIVFFYSEKCDVWCIGNRYDFTPINKNSVLEFIEIEPARGSGYKELVVNSLTFNDSYDSEILETVVEALELRTELTFTRRVAYDD